MAVLMSCPGCQKRLRADESIHGRRVRCSRCGQSFVASTEGLPKAPPRSEDRPDPAPIAAAAPDDSIPLAPEPAAAMPGPAPAPTPSPDEPKVVVVAVAPSTFKHIAAACAVVLIVAAVVVVVRAGGSGKAPEGDGSVSPSSVPVVLPNAGDLIARGIADAPSLVATDPDGDCRVEVDGSAVAFEVSGTFHDLTGGSGIAPASGRRNAPRALAPVSGDFVAEATLPGEYRPEPKPVGIGAPYHGAGLLFWKDPNNFIRLERAAVARSGKVEEYANFVLCRDGWVEQVETAPLPDGTIALRLERKDQDVSASVRGEDGAWRRISGFAVDWKGPLSIGAVAVNSSAAPLVCRVEGITVRESSGTRPFDRSALARANADAATRPDAPPIVGPLSAPPLPAPPAAKSPPEEDSAQALTTAEIVRRCEPSVALVRGGSSSGTGFVVRPGVIATNAHVIEDELLANLEVRFPSASGAEARPQPAELLYEDRPRDLALLRVGKTPPPLAVARDFPYVKGEDIVVIGSPGFGGGDEVLENAVSRGVLSVKTTIDGREFYQMGIAINPGNSGGPVFDTRGRVIGVATKKTTKQEALAFCVPSRDLASAIDRLDALNPGDLKQTRAKHDVKPTFKLLACAGAVHAIILDLHVLAKSRNVPMSDPTLKEARDELEKLERTLFPGMDAAATAIGQDGAVPGDVRDGIATMAREVTALRLLLGSAPTGGMAAISARLSAARRSLHDAVARVGKGLDEPPPPALLAILDGSYLKDKDLAGALAEGPSGSIPRLPPGLPIPTRPDLPGFRDRFGLGPRLGPQLGPRVPMPGVRPPLGGSRITPRGRSRLGR